MCVIHLVDLSLLIGQRLRPELLHLLDAEPPERVLEEGAAGLVAGGLPEPGRVHEGAPGRHQGRVEALTVLVCHLEE